MDNLIDGAGLDLAGVAFDIDFLERVNPVFNTAKMTLYQLASDGDESAQALVEKLGLTADTQSKTAEADEQTVSNVMLEVRFRTTGAMAERSGCPTVVDLPCGYTPRGIEFADKKIRYVGLDLPATILEAKPAVTSLLAQDKRDMVDYFGVDATNYASLKAALDNVEGEVCITTEGLLMYFTDSETAELCDNVRRILQEHGGCWILADAETTTQYILTARAFYGDRFMEVMKRQKAHVDKKSDVDVQSRILPIIPSADPAEGIKKAMAFLAKYGLKAERLVVADYVPKIKSLETIPADKAAQITESMKLYAYWKITPISVAALDTHEVAGKDMALEASLSDGVLMLKVTGRVDTLTAPALLDFFEKTAKEHEISEVRVDCVDLAYISSAGLRVLMIMMKNCKDGVTLEGVNATVREIVEQTGFDSILNVLD